VPVGGSRGQESITVGLLTDMSNNAMDFTGPGSVTATRMAIDDFNGTVLGRPAKVISGDHQMKPDLYLVQVKTAAESKAPWDYYMVLATIPGDQAFPKLEDGGCPLVTK
jgi:hypothetical protein